MRTELDPARNQLEAAKTEAENPTFSNHPVHTYRSDTRTVEFIQALNAAAANIQKSVQSEDEIFRTFTEQVTSMGLRGGLAILDEAGTSATIRALAQPPGLLRKLSRFEKIFGIKVLGYSFPITNVKTYNAVIESRDSLFVADSTATIAQLLPPFAQPLSRTILGAFGRTATVYAPLIVDGRVIGILNIAGPAITADDRPAIQAFANHIGIALTNQRLYLEAQREIGDRREAQEKLRESEERFRQLWEATLEGIAIHHNGVLVEANPAILRLFGFSREQVIGRSIFDFAPPEVQDVMRQKIASGDERPYEATFVRPDGSRLILEVTGRNAEFQGRTQRIVSVRDITERKRTERALQESEKRYRTLFEDSPIALWEEDFSAAKRYLDHLREKGVTDIRSYLAQNPGELSKIAAMVRVVNLNKAALKMYRTNDPAVLFGNLQQILVPETIDGFEEELVAIAEDQSYFTIESRDRVATGDVIDINLSWTMSPGTNDYSRVIVSVVDVTERKRAEEIIGQYAVELERRVEERTAELNRINLELARANRAKDEFLATMSHELRTPLNSILGFSEALLERRRGPLNEKQDEYVRLISSSGAHLLNLITDILEVSKIEAGKLSIQPDLISVKEVCESSLNFIRETALKKSISVEFRNEQSIGSLWADPQRLKQVLVNLLNNAVKFTPEHGLVSLEVGISPEKDRIIFSVQDNGIGIAPSDLKKLFTPFTQLDSSLARQYEGTGLGLVLVYKLTDLHGGSVQVESEPGKGSRFSVILPWSEQPDQHPDLASTSESATPAAASPLSEAGKLVLLAEDNQANVLAIHEYLLDHGYNVIVARNGLEAIASAEKLRPGIILMDIQMPEMDGLEAIRRLRSNRIFDGTPIVAITALAMPGDRARCLEAGADEYMSKPVSLRHLLQTIVRLLQ